MTTKTVQPRKSEKPDSDTKTAIKRLQSAHGLLPETAPERLRIMGVLRSLPGEKPRRPNYAGTKPALDRLESAIDLLPPMASQRREIAAILHTLAPKAERDTNRVIGHGRSNAVRP